MNLIESFRIALTALEANKLRSALTMLGVIIGVAAVITLLGIGEGVQASITERIESLGTNLLTIFGRGGNLTWEDAEAIANPANVLGVDIVAPIANVSADVVYEDTEETPSVYGTTADYVEVRSLEMASGVFISEDDVDDKARVCVLGATIATDLFPDGQYAVGQKVKIDRVKYAVIGVLEEKGGTGMSSEDETVFIPISTAQRYFPSRSIYGGQRIANIYVQMVSEDVMDQAETQITALLRERHRLTENDDDDFRIMNQAEMLEMSTKVTDILTLFLGVIAGISLLVGGIGVMNIMLVSVTERTREIGIRKAVGAKRLDILAQFLVEALTLSLLGGLLGIGLGFAASGIIARVNPDMAPRITTASVLMATSFSIMVGLFFGIYPAKRAGDLNPIDALRYE